MIMSNVKKLLNLNLARFTITKIAITSDLE